MPRTVYALLVGIDKYPASIRSLNGCVNDIQRVQALLADRIGRAGDRFEPLPLLDNNATRQARVARAVTARILAPRARSSRRDAGLLEQPSGRWMGSRGQRTGAVDRRGCREWPAHRGNPGLLPLGLGYPRPRRACRRTPSTH